MTIDELIARLMRLSEDLPHRGRTEVVIRFEGDLKVEGASLGRAQLPRGRSPKSPVVILQSHTVHRALTTRRMPARSARYDEDSNDQTVQDAHAEATRSRLCRAIARKIEQDAVTGEQYRPLEHLLRVIESEKLGRTNGANG